MENEDTRNEAFRAMFVGELVSWIQEFGRERAKAMYKDFALEFLNGCAPDTRATHMAMFREAWKDAARKAAH